MFVRWQLTGINSVKEVSTLLLLLDIRINEQRIRLRVNILHHDLKPIETTRFGNLHFSTEPLDQVLIHDPVRRGEESQDVRDEVAFVVV